MNLTHNDACSLTKAFFYYVLNELTEISSDASQRLQLFYCVTEGDSATPWEWKYDYTKTSHKPFTRAKGETVVTLQEALSATIAYATTYSYEIDFDLFELTAMLHAMRSHPHLYKNEWRIWQRAFRAVCEIRFDERVK